MRMEDLQDYNPDLVEPIDVSERRIQAFKPISADMSKAIYERQKLEEGLKTTRNVNYIDSSRFKVEQGLMGRGAASQGALTVGGFAYGSHRSDYIDLVYSGRKASRTGELVMDSDFSGCIDVSRSSLLIQTSSTSGQRLR